MAPAELETEVIPPVSDASKPDVVHAEEGAPDAPPVAVITDPDNTTMEFGTSEYSSRSLVIHGRLS